MSGSPQPVVWKAEGSIAVWESYKIPQNRRKAASTSGFWKSQEVDADTEETPKQATASGDLGQQAG